MPNTESTVHGAAHPDRQDVDTGAGVVKLAIMAVGGQGGGVLTQWITDLAEKNGYAAQATSVAGVAQRTGATIYYVEMAPRSARQPVFSLMPSAGDVDILVAAELMEAGRAMIRGFVTPDRTTLIASTHRNLAVTEKTSPGNGIASSERVLSAASTAASRVIAFDMERIAVDAGTVISASLFGALAGSGTLPFSRKRFEETIRASGRGVEASLAAFSAACDLAARQNETTDSVSGEASVQDEIRGPEKLLRDWRALSARIDALPEPTRNIALAGLKKVVDFQDIDYGSEYLDHVERVLRVDDETGGDSMRHTLTTAAAKHIANAMAYDDVIRVADLKTRASRISRVERELGLTDAQVAQITEFMHPRAEEICGTLPAAMGSYVLSRPKLFGALDRLVNRGRRVRTDAVGWFLVLYVLGGMRRFRRRLLRHRIESRHLRSWLSASLDQAPRNYQLAVELINNRRLIKGYSDTHARGQSKFDRVMSATDVVAMRDDAADCMRQLREAALADPAGVALDELLEKFTRTGTS